MVNNGYRTWQTPKQEKKQKPVAWATEDSVCSEAADSVVGSDSAESSSDTTSLTPSATMTGTKAETTAGPLVIAAAKPPVGAPTGSEQAMEPSEPFGVASEITRWHGFRFTNVYVSGVHNG